MKRLALFTLSLLTALVVTAGLGWAAPSITSFTGTPTTFVPRVQTKVNMTVQVTDQTFNPKAVQVQRQAVDGSWKNFVKTDFLPTSNPLVFTGKAGFNENTTGAVRIRLAATFTASGKNKYFSPVLELSVGQSATPSAGDQTIQGAGGTSVTIEGGSLQTEAFVGIAPAPAGVVPVASEPQGIQQQRPLVTTVDVIVEPTAPVEGPVLTEPLKVSVPAPPGTPTTARFYFVVPVLAPGAQGGLQQKLLYVDTGTVVNGQIVTESTVFPGIFSSTTVAVVQETGSATVVGVVKDANTNPRPGVWVEECTPDCTQDQDQCPAGQLCSYGFYSDAEGNYRGAVTGTCIRVGPNPCGETVFQLRAIDGFRCNEGTHSETVASGGIYTRDLTVNAVQPFPQRLTGVRNNGFEAGQPTPCWVNLTSGQVIQRDTQDYRDLFGFSTTIEPSEEDFMVALTSAQASIEQTFLVPTLFSGAPKKLHFDFTFACRNDLSCPAAATSNIGLTAQLLNPSDNAVLTSVAPAPTFMAFGGQLGWRTGELNVASITPGTSVKLRFTRSNADTDNSVVLLDNIRFDTVFVNVNIMAGSSTDEALARTQVRNANELLSQAGTNVRIRSVATGTSQVDSICNPGPTPLDFFGGLGTDVTWGPIVFGDQHARTSEQIALSCIGARVAAGRNAPNSDVEINYVEALHDGGDPNIFGAAITVEDYVGFGGAGTFLNFAFMAGYNANDPNTVKNETAIIMPHLTDPNRIRETFAHEITHLLINQNLGDGFNPIAGVFFEHGSDPASVAVAPATCFSTPTNVCSGRVHLNVAQLSRWSLPGPPGSPRCPVTCPH